jgi:hypothetical protein
VFDRIQVDERLVGVFPTVEAAVEAARKQER